MKKGSLVILKSWDDINMIRNHNKAPTLYEISRAPYTARFMEPQDRDMEEAGMGNLAGVYTSAIDIVAITGPTTGNVYRRQLLSNYRTITEDSPYPAPGQADRK